MSVLLAPPSNCSVCRPGGEGGRGTWATAGRRPARPSPAAARPDPRLGNRPRPYFQNQDVDTVWTRVVSSCPFTTRSCIQKCTVTRMTMPIELPRISRAEGRHTLSWSARRNGASARGVIRDASAASRQNRHHRQPQTSSYGIRCVVCRLLPPVA